MCAWQVRKLTSQQRRERKRRLEKRKAAQAVVARMTLGEDGARLLGDKELRPRDLRSMRNLADPMFTDQARRTPGGCGVQGSASVSSHGMF